MLAEYKFLTEHVSMWDVAVERQIQVKGPDAAAFVDYLITRDVHSLMPNMRARYVILCNQYGGIINDPVLLRVADDEFWFSISDSDVLLWAQGVNATGRFQTSISTSSMSLQSRSRAPSPPRSWRRCSAPTSARSPTTASSTKRSTVIP